MFNQREKNKIFDLEERIRKLEIRLDEQFLIEYFDVGKRDDFCNPVWTRKPTIPEHRRRISLILEHLGLEEKKIEAIPESWVLVKKDESPR